MQPSQSSQTIVLRDPPATQGTLTLQSRLLQRNTNGLCNIPQQTRQLVQLITASDLFTPAQKAFIVDWESHFIQLLDHPNESLPAKALCFLSIKIITPVLMKFSDNQLVQNRLFPIIQEHENLLQLCLPEGTHVEEYMIEREKMYDLMIETKQVLNQIVKTYNESEQLLILKVNGLKDKILSNSNSSRDLLHQLAKKWESKVTLTHDRLESLNINFKKLHERFEAHANALEEVGNQLATGQQSFDKTIQNITNLLKNV